MRIWVIISSVVILLFCVPGLVLTLAAPVWQDILVYLVLNALAIHGLYYAKVSRTEPARGYPHMAAGQLLLGIVCAALLVRLGYLFSDPQPWEIVHQQMRELFRQMPGLDASPQEIEYALQQVLEPARKMAMQVLLLVAALTFVSQAVFAWMLYRKGRPKTAAEG